MVLRWRRDGVGHFEVVSDLPFQRAAMRMRFDGIGHFEVVSDLPFPRKAEHAREAECSRVVWVRPRDGELITASNQEVIIRTTITYTRITP